MSDLGNDALEIRVKGFPIFPVEPRGKTPLVPWKPYQEKLPSEAQVRNWWHQWPDANIGMATGHLSQLLVIDVDSPEAFNILVKVYPDIIRTSWAQTGRGWHFYFKWEEGIPNSAGVLAPGIDVRSEGGFVVLPPSVHANGEMYQWLNGRVPKPLPVALKEPLRGPHKEKPNAAFGEQKSARILQGQRNQTLTSLSGTMRKRGMSGEAIEAALIAENECRCDPPLPEDEVKRIASSVARYHPSNQPPIGDEVRDGTEIIWAKDVPPPGEGEEIESLWGPFLYPASLHLLAGEAGIGKTTFGYNLVIRLAKGEFFAGLLPARPLRVLYYDLETPPLLFKKKLHLISDDTPPDGLAFTRTFNVNKAKKLIQEHCFDVLVIDTANEAFDTREEEDNAEANRQMRQLRLIIKETGVAILVFYHMAKEPSQKGVYRTRGASARPAAADVVLNLERIGTRRQLTENGETLIEIIRLEAAKNRWDEKANLTLMKIGKDRFEIAEADTPIDQSQQGIVEALILELLPCEPESVETKKILEETRKEGFSRPTVERVLKKLTDTCQINRPQKGFYCRPMIHPSSQGYRGIGMRGRRNGLDSEFSNWGLTLFPSVWV
jgi:Bifunctional DNA primase/polymerase, N-terminal/AAA domain/Primase C terminal 1 (PriCT-1)